MLGMVRQGASKETERRGYPDEDEVVEKQNYYGLYGVRTLVSDCAEHLLLAARRET